MIREWDFLRDLFPVFKFLLAYQARFPEEISPPDPDKVFNCLIESATSGGKVFLFEKEGAIVGVLILQEVTMWWGNETLLHNLVWYVLPEHRSVRTLNLFLKKAQECARIKGLELCVELPFSLVNKQKAERILTARYGFRSAGQYFKKK